MELRSDNPCDRIGPVFGAQVDIVTHRQALPHRELAAVVETVRTSTSGQVAVKLAFELLVLTAARSAEVRLATWEEMDVAGRVWTIATEGMKAKREHRVPLCGRAVEILEAARELAGNSRLVFPMRSGTPIAASTLPKMLKYLGVSAVPHGFRSSFRDWAVQKTDHPREVIEAAYARSDLFERRRLLMDDWARYLDVASGPAGQPGRGRIFWPAPCLAGSVSGRASLPQNPCYRMEARCRGSVRPRLRRVQAKVGRASVGGAVFYSDRRNASTARTSRARDNCGRS